MTKKIIHKENLSIIQEFVDMVNKDNLLELEYEANDLKVKIENDDTISISKKVLKIEHEILPYTVGAFCDDRIHWENNKPLIIGT